jgi:hypothetical protein
MRESTGRIQKTKATHIKKIYVCPQLQERSILSETKANTQPGVDHFGTGSDGGPIIS